MKEVFMTLQGVHRFQFLCPLM
uniref:Uncharacterized protein n=1 Tax=Anguilla anguilla TaxID=7936 RepID=A0A0E9PER7_ANGAN